ncbi:sensor domain-containing diguanylate cyclase [Desulfonauticus submarinus]|nr:sensor domain-containing diguanylate cyclase [Desulfonauticus submarinus]
MIMIFSISFSIIFYYSRIENINTILKYKNLSLKYFIEGEFIKIYNSVKFLSKNKKVRNLLTLDESAKKDVLRLYKTLSEIDKSINYIYSGYKNKSLVINNYIPPINFDPTTRPWYQAAIKSNPKISDGVLYQEMKSKEWLISVSKVLVDDQNKISGVIAVDYSLDRILHILNAKDKNLNTLFSYIIKLDGSFIAYKNKNFFGKKIFDIFHISIDFNKNKSGTFTYTYNNSKKLAYFNRIDAVGWVVITTVNMSEITSPIINKILVIIISISFISILLGWLYSRSLSKKIVLPLLNLKKDVEMVVKGHNLSNKIPKYPKNEIGAIASYIEQLTRSELYNKNKALQKANNQLAMMSITDQLTKLFNRRKIIEELENEKNRFTRYGKVFSIIMFDIDWFKQINDSYGHQAGDAVLQDIANITKKIFRITDTISRWGGEEFMILCPETSMEEAQVIATRLKTAVASHKFKINKKITISIGIAEYNSNKSIEELLKEVDDKLYVAKRRGRDVIVY